MISKFLLSLAIIGIFTSNGEALANETEPLSNNASSSMNFEQFFGQGPESIVLFKGNQKKLDPGGKVYDVCFQIIPFPWDTPVKGTLVNAVAMNFKSPLDGFATFQLHGSDWDWFQTSVQLIQKRVKDQIFEVTLFPGQKCWDFAQNKMQTKQYLVLSSNKTLTRTTSLGYLKDGTGTKKIKIDVNEYLRILDPCFFKNAPENTLVAARLFKVNGKFPKKEIRKRVKSVRFEKSDDLTTGPFDLEIVTREPNDIEAADLIADEFDKESCFLTQLSSREYLLSVHTDAVDFYQMLRLLLTIGYPDD